MNKEPLTPCDGLSDLLVDNDTQLQMETAEQRKLNSGTMSNSHTILDSIQLSLSLEMQGMSEHTMNTNMKYVKMSSALKKAASLHTFNEHLEH